jgi:hypothetical protein
MKLVANLKTMAMERSSLEPPIMGCAEPTAIED